MLWLKKGFLFLQAMLSKNKRPYGDGKLPGSKRLRQNLGHAFSTNQLSGAQVMDIAQDVNSVAPSEFFELSKAKSRHHFAQTLKRKLLKRGQPWLDDYVDVDVCCSKPSL